MSPLMPQKSFIAGASLLLTLTLLSGETAAQQNTPAAPQASQLEVSEAKLDRFVGAYLEVSKISQELQKKMAAVQDPAAARALQQQANKEMLAAVEAASIKVDDYNTIVSAMQKDEKLKKRVDQKVVEIVKKQQERGKAAPSGTKP